MPGARRGKSDTGERPRRDHFRSIFDRSEEWLDQRFPERASRAGGAAGGGEGVSSEAQAPSLGEGAAAGLSDWDIAARYHEFRRKLSNAGDVRALRRLSARAILERAKAVLGSVVHPVIRATAPMTELPAGVHSDELDIEETLENSPLSLTRNGVVVPDDIWVEYSIHRSQRLVLTIDTSLSMTGEKLALTAVAVAVVLLQFPDDPVGIVAFENEAKVLKRPYERLSVFELVERFLEVPAMGYTHLEDGMEATLSMIREEMHAGRSGRVSTVLLSDGKYTAGRDPSFLAPRFSHLVVLKMGRDRASLQLCRELASLGGGVMREVAHLETLPVVMYGVVKDLLRGQVRI